MSFEPVHTKDAPDAIGPYSQAVRCGDMVFCSGQIPIDPATGALVAGSIEDQAHRVLKNLQAILQAAGTGMNQVVKTTIYLTELSNFQKVNQVYGSYFQKPFPARVTVQVSALPKNADIEIDAIAKVL